MTYRAIFGEASSITDPPLNRQPGPAADTDRAQPATGDQEALRRLGFPLVRSSIERSPENEWRREQTGAPSAAPIPRPVRDGYEATSRCQARTGQRR